MMNDQYISCVPNTIRVEPMQVIRNLIAVKITDQQLNAANFIEGIKIQVRCEKPFTVNAFWLVKIIDIHSEIEKDWKTMRDELWDNKFLAANGKCLFQSRPQIYQQSNEEVECSVKPPHPIDTSKMLTTPRDFYPLVIIITCHEEEPNPQETGAAANIHIVHIQDSIVPIKSHVIKQYTKQMDGRILDISQVYAEESAACFICFEEANPEERLQLFCLLPCRHMPICSNCIGRIRECPKCRCPIASVFDINAPSASCDQQEGNQRRQEIDPSLRYLYDDAESDSRAGASRQGGFFATIRSFFSS